MPMRSERERLASAPAKARDEELAVGGRQFLAVVGRSVKVRGNLVGAQAGDGSRDGVLTGKGVGAAAVGPGTAEQVRRDYDVALRGQFVGHFLGPVAQAEDLV